MSVLFLPGGEENIRAKVFDADKIVKYFDDTVAKKEAMIKKVAEKNHALRGQITKVENQLKNKEEQGIFYWFNQISNVSFLQETL